MNLSLASSLAHLLNQCAAAEFENLKKKRFVFIKGNQWSDYIYYIYQKYGFAENKFTVIKIMKFLYNKY